MDQGIQKPLILCRPFMRDEWALCRAIRLEALLEEPSVFSSNYSTEEKQSELYWQDTASSAHCTMMALFDGSAVIGCVGIATMRADTTGESAILWGTYVRKDYRGRSFSGFLYQTLIDFAVLNAAWKRIVVSHRKSNLPSKGVTLSHGFLYTHTEMKVWPDGQEEEHLFYVLDIELIRKSLT